MIKKNFIVEFIDANASLKKRQNITISLTILFHKNDALGVNTTFECTLVTNGHLKHDKCEDIFWTSNSLWSSLLVQMHNWWKTAKNRGKHWKMNFDQEQGVCSIYMLHLLFEIQNILQTNHLVNHNFTSFTSQCYLPLMLSLKSQKSLFMFWNLIIKLKV